MLEAILTIMGLLGLGLLLGFAESGYNLRDALLRQTKALPDGAATTTSDPIELHPGAHNSAFLANSELLLTIPALATALLPDTQTVTYTLEASNDPEFNSGVDVISPAVVQTGAAGAGAAGTTLRVRPPTNVKRYVRAKAVKTGAANASAASMTVELLH